MNKKIQWIVCLFLTGLAIVLPAWAATTPPVTVGRVYHIEGDLLRYVPEEKDWVAMVKDAPFGTGDALFSGTQGMAEMIVPNGTWLRLGNSTQIQFIALDADLSEVDVAEGVARFYNKGAKTVIKTTSPFGYVLADPGTVFDVYVGDNSVEVIAVKGKVSFIHTATDARYDVAAGSASILADAGQVSSGEGAIDPEWNKWNKKRENTWAAKARMTGRSVKYLPSNLQGESYALEENGRWESVPYEGSSRWFWRPTSVAVGWSPFTAGRWTDWNGDQVWIPAESFGYVTHHYGNWIYTRNSWYWAPPVANLRVRRPMLLDIGFFWSPGRVSWIHHDNYVGWVPLAPRETYYSHRRWGGRHDVVVTNNITRININIGSYAYARHAVVVPRDNFYRVNNYKTVSVTNISNTTIINNYRAAPVVNNTVINNYTTNKERHSFTNEKVKEKPHNTVISRIEKNAPVIQKGKKENAVVVLEQVKHIKEGKVNREARIEAPKSTNHIVPTNEVNRPKSEIKLQQRDIKTGGKPNQPLRPQQVSPASPAKPAQPDSRVPSVTDREKRPIPVLDEKDKKPDGRVPSVTDREKRPIPILDEKDKKPDGRVPSVTDREKRPIPILDEKDKKPD
ncbi:MAG: FecR domain-containing protein, partial [Smithellaceae bacterium]|nr:FecR domain-containing protein [Smithellaceae bacterium]